jgi:UDP-glucose 4-epimerase
VLDDLSNGRRENVNAAASLHEGDNRDPDAVFDEVRPEVVFHLAAQANVRTSVERPELDADVNVLGTVRILEAARRHGAQVVFSSTGGAIYGECREPAGEDAARQPLSPYGTSKLCGEEYLATWNRLYGTSHVSLRFGNVYGPRQEPHGEAGVVAIFMGLLTGSGTPTIYGDGRQTRDYVYVGDVVDAVLGAVGHGGGVYNVGTGVETSVLELYDEIAGATGIEREPRHAEARLGELQRSVLDPVAAQRDLGWRPQTSLADGLRATWEWVRQED